MSIREKINSLLEKNNKSIIETYFTIQYLLNRHFGKNTILLFEIGSFYEMYSVDDSNGEVIGMAKEVSELLNIQLTRKNKNINEISIKNPYMAGFPSNSLEKHISYLIKNSNMTIALVKQEKNDGIVYRHLDKIISPGVNFDFNFSSEKNQFSVINIDMYNDIYSVGFSAIDVMTGEVSVFEYHSPSEDRFKSLEKINNFLIPSVNSEVILNFKNKDINEKEVFEVLNISPNSLIIFENLKNSFQNSFLKELYNIESFLSPIEYLDMEHFPLASESMVLLFKYVLEQDKNLLINLKKPIILKDDYFLYLGNNPLEQLNVFSNSNDINLLQFLNKCSTAIGKRAFKERLMHPIINPEEIERRYLVSESFRGNYNELSNILKRIYDIERLVRRIELFKLHPYELYNLYSSLLAIVDVWEFTSKEFIEFDGIEKLMMLINYIEDLFDLEELNKYNIDKITGNIFNRGKLTNVDKAFMKKKNLLSSLKEFENELNNLLSPFVENRNNFNKNPLISMEYTETDGYFFKMTLSRFKHIEKLLPDSYTVVKNKSGVKITSPEIQQLTLELKRQELICSYLISSEYNSVLENIMNTYGNLFKKLVLFIIDVDIGVCNIKNSIQRGYVQPEIIDSKDNFIEAIDLRHPIVEANEDLEIFVPNNVFLGDLSLVANEHKDKILENMNDQTNGMLLFGLNSSGKTIYQKSIGLAVIMAQAGFYVPASSFRFSIFNSIFTRIVGQDNIQKGLSTFAIEMLELKNILNRGNNKSLVIGDEICHGTETISGVSIVASAIVELVNMKSLFVFATHLHQLSEMDEITSLDEVAFVHLSVDFDKASKKISYRRKLSPGVGSSMYGLEFAHSLVMKDTFLNRAEKFRRKILKEENSIDNLLENKKSRYNSRLFLNKCAICNSTVEEVHHIEEQYKADENNRIGHFRKNHKSNLVPLCKKHHNSIHNGEIIIDGYIMTEKGLVLDYHTKEV